MSLTVAFFFIGKQTTIPAMLVESFNKIMGKNFSIIQLSDYDSPKVEGVTDVARFNLSKDIMVARLQAYSMYQPTSEETFFCDADGLFINQIVLPKVDKKIFLTQRNYNPIINFNYPEFYPEFVEKKFNQVMPFLFGAIAIRGDQSKVFKKLLNICNQLPPRFHRWYGDQYSLYLSVKKNNFEYSLLDQEIYLKILYSPLNHNEILKLKNNNTQFITYKGPESKSYLLGTFNSLLNQ